MLRWLPRLPDMKAIPTWSGGWDEGEWDLLSASHILGAGDVGRVRHAGDVVEDDAIRHVLHHLRRLGLLWRRSCI